MRNQGSADRLESMRNQYGARPVRHRSRSRSRSQSVGEEEIELDRGAAWTPESPAAKDAPAAEWYLRTALEKGQLPLQTPDGDLAFPEPGDSTKQPIDQEAVESFAEAVVFSASRGLERDLDELFRTAVQAAGEWPRPGTFKERVVRAFFAQFMISTSDDFMRAFDVDSLSAGADSTDTAAFYHATATKRRFLEGKMALESARYRTSISELDGFRARVERDWGKSGPLAARLLPAMMRDLLHRAIAVSGDPARRSKLKDPVGAVHAILRQGWQIYTWFPNAFVDVLKKPEFVVAWDRNAKRGGRWGKEEVEVVVNSALGFLFCMPDEPITQLHVNVFAFLTKCLTSHNVPIYGAVFGFFLTRNWSLYGALEQGSSQIPESSSITYANLTMLTAFLLLVSPGDEGIAGKLVPYISTLAEGSEARGDRLVLLRTFLDALARAISAVGEAELLIAGLEGVKQVAKIEDWVGWVLEQYHYYAKEQETAGARRSGNPRLAGLLAMCGKSEMGGRKPKPALLEKGVVEALHEVARRRLAGEGNDEVGTTVMAVLHRLFYNAGLGVLTGGAGWVRIRSGAADAKVALHAGSQHWAAGTEMHLSVLEKCNELAPFLVGSREAAAIRHEIGQFLAHHVHLDARVEEARKCVLQTLGRSNLDGEGGKSNDKYDAMAGICELDDLVADDQRREDTAAVAVDPLEVPAEGKGLSNLGNTCFMNSLLQSLFASSGIPLYEPVMLAAGADSHSPELLRKAKMRNEVIAFHFATSADRRRESTVTDALSRLFALLLFSEDRSITPREFLDTQPSWIRSGRQQDAAEFMKVLFDRIETDWKDAVKAGRTFPDPLRQFRGQTVTAIACLGGCGGTSYRGEEFTDLTLPFKVEEKEELQLLTGGTGSFCSGGSLGKTNSNLNDLFGGKGSSATSFSFKAAAADATVSTANATYDDKLWSSEKSTAALGRIMQQKAKPSSASEKSSRYFTSAIGAPSASPVQGREDSPPSPTRTHDIFVEEDDMFQAADDQADDVATDVDGESGRGFNSQVTEVGSNSTRMLDADGFLQENDGDEFRGYLDRPESPFSGMSPSSTNREMGDAEVGSDAKFQFNNYYPIGQDGEQGVYEPILELPGIPEDPEEPAGGLRGGSMDGWELKDSFPAPDIPEEGGFIRPTPSGSPSTGALDGGLDPRAFGIGLDEDPLTEPRSFIGPLRPGDSIAVSEAPVIEGAAELARQRVEMLKAVTADRGAIQAEASKDANTMRSGGLSITSMAKSASSWASKDTAPTPAAPASPPKTRIKKVRTYMPTTIQEMLESILASEQLNEANGNAYSCDRCGKKTCATRTTYLQRVPNVLIVSANRFEYDFAVGRRKKISCDIAGDWSVLRADVLVKDVVAEQKAREEKEAKEKEVREAAVKDGKGKKVAAPNGQAVDAASVDMDLEGTLLTADASGDLTPPVTPVSPKTRAVFYDLYAVVFHSGYSADYGHYYAFAAQEAYDGPPVESEKAAETARVPWIQYNDSSVRRNLKLDDVMNEARGGDTPYILFYRRRSDAPAEYLSPDPSLAIDVRALVDFVSGHDGPAYSTPAVRSAPPAPSPVRKRQRFDDDDDELGGSGSGMDHLVPKWTAA